MPWRGTTPPSLEGAEGVAVGDLTPEGIVRVRGEEWSAVSVNGDVRAGCRVQVLRALGVHLEVWGEESEALPRGPKRQPRQGQGAEHVIVGIIIGVVVLFVLVMLAFSVKIIREYQRIVLFRLGRAVGVRGPGLVLINPVTDRTSWVDLRERFLEIPHQTAITKDNASISIDFIIFYKVVDPSMTVLQVQNFAAAAQNVAATDASERRGGHAPR